MTWNLAASNDRRYVNHHRAGERLADPTATVVCGVGGLWRLARICVCDSVRFRPEQICAVTDSVSEQQLSVRSISSNDRNLRLRGGACLPGICILVAKVRKLLV